MLELVYGSQFKKDFKKARKLPIEDLSNIFKIISTLQSQTDAQSQNQMVRWVTNKEEHAQKIISTISDYFLTQRVKASQADYTARLVKHHTVIVAAMKAKQNAEAKYAKDLKAAIQALTAYYHKH